MQGPGPGAADLYAEARLALDLGAWTDVLRLAGQALAVDPLHAGASELVVVARRQLEVATRGEGERRQLSILFADIVGSTSLANELGAEAYRDVLLAVHRAAVQAITQYEGRIAQYLGDGILAYFSYPQAHEDDPRRAILAGLALVERVGGLATGLRERHGQAPEVRVGIDTGLVVVGGLGSGEWTTSDSVVGDPPNIAARLQSMAGPGDVLVSGATHALTRPYFTFEAVGAVELRNFPASVEVLRARAARDMVAQDVTPERVAFVGRELELSQLADAWSAVLEGECREVLLVGDAGIGKSRLIEQLANLVTASGGRRIELRCAGLYRHSAFWPVRAALARLFSKGDGVTAASVADIGDALQQLGWAAGSYDAAAVLGRLLGLDVTLDLLPEQWRKRTLDVCVELFGLLATASVVLLVVEDAHDADASTLDLLELLRARRFGPALVVATSRSALARGAAWATEVAVGPLPAAAGVELVRAVHPDAAHADIEAVLGKADGVPLFIEELARNAAQDADDVAAGSAAPARVDDGGRGGRPSAALAWASASRAVLGTRVDALEPDSRRLASDLAVQGTDARYDVAAAMSDLAPAALERALQDLVTRRVLTPDAVAPSRTFRFRHALIRDAVYDSQLAGDRRRRHRRCATALRTRLESGEPILPEIVAAHLTEGGEGREAVPWWQRAAEQSASAAANVEAMAHYRRALSLLDQVVDPVEHATLEFGLQLGLGLSAATIEGYGSDAVLGAFERADALGQAFGDHPGLLPAVWGMWSFHLVRGEHERAENLAERCLTMADRAHDDDTRRVVGTIVGYQRFFLGDFPAAAAELTLASRAAGEPVLPFPQDPAIAGLANLAVTSWIAGDVEGSDAQLHWALQQADALTGRRAEFTRAFVLSFAAWLAQLADDGDTALRYASRALDISTENSFATWLGAASLHLAGALCSLGRPEEGLPLFCAALEGYRKAGAELMVPYFLGRLGVARVGAGEVDAGLADLDEAIDRARTNGERCYLAELHRLRAAARRSQGRPGVVVLTDDPAAVRDDLVAAAVEARAQGALTFEVRALLDLYRLDHTGVGADDASPDRGDGDREGDVARRLGAALAQWGERMTIPEVRLGRELLAAHRLRGGR